MTPPDLPPDDAPLDDDTLAVHAVVDDEATAEQRRRVARDPELVAQVAALRAVTAAVAEPVAPPPADLLADLRRRALDALDEPAGAPSDPGAGPADDDGLAPDPVLPVRDLAAARARRSRSLPPLPAVAAVVVLLVVVGVGLLVAGTGGQGDSSADSGGAGSGVAEEAATEGGDDAASASTTGAESDAATAGPAEERPADATRDALLARTTARYPTQEALERELRLVDVETLALGDAPTETPDQEGGEATTTAPPPGSSPGEADEDTARAFAADPVATRCDDVLQAAEPDLEPAVAAALVAVQGEPVLVLSNPTEVSERAPNGLRLTVLNAVDCSPRSAVLR